MIVNDFLAGVTSMAYRHTAMPFECKGLGVTDKAHSSSSAKYRYLRNSQFVFSELSSVIT